MPQHAHTILLLPHFKAPLTISYHSLLLLQGIPWSRPRYKSKTCHKRSLLCLCPRRPTQEPEEPAYALPRREADVDYEIPVSLNAAYKIFVSAFVLAFDALLSYFFLSGTRGLLPMLQFFYMHAHIRCL